MPTEGASAGVTMAAALTVPAGRRATARDAGRDYCHLGEAVASTMSVLADGLDA